VSREIWAGRRGAGERENQNEGGKAEFRDLGKRNEGGSGSGGSSRGAEKCRLLFDRSSAFEAEQVRERGVVDV
jgi:hypothetical protein